MLQHMAYLWAGGARGGVLRLYYSSTIGLIYTVYVGVGLQALRNSSTHSAIT